MNQPNFIVRVLIIFIPSLLFLVLMKAAGVTDNIFMTIICLLAFVWFVQAIYKKILKKQAEKSEK